MSFTSRSSTDVLKILPFNTWTEVVLIDVKPIDKDVYLATTEDNIKKRIQDMDFISTQIHSCQKVEKFIPYTIVAIEIDGIWFRGRLTSFNEFLPDNTRVELIDVGQIYNTKLDNLFLLPYYFNYEPLVLPIKFKDGYIPEDRKLSVKPLFSESLLHVGLVFVEAKRDHEKQNDLSKCINSVDDGIYSTQTMTNGLHDCLSSLIKNNVSNYKKNSKPKLHSIPLSNGTAIPLLNDIVCLLTFVESFDSVFVGKAIKNDITGSYDLSNFDILLKTAESKDKIPYKNFPAFDKFVKVFSPEFKTLFRAKILGSNIDGTFDVFYIDYGNIENVESNVIFELEDELQKPGIAIKVGISGFKNFVFTEEIKDMFEEFIENGKPFVIKIDEKSSDCLQYVKLKDMENESFIDISYIKKYLQDNSKSHNSVLSVDENIELLNSNQPNDFKNHDIVFLKHFESITEVYITKNAKLFNNLMLDIIQDNSFVPKTNINVGDLVKVSPANSVYRGKVIKVNNTSIYVQNIDFGYYETVDATSICELSNDLRKIPGLAFKIGIKGPLLKKSELLTNFVNVNERVPLYLEFDELSSNRYQEVTLIRKDNSKNIFDEFLKIKPSTVSNEGNLMERLNLETKSTTKECSNSRFKSISLENGDYCLISYFQDFKNIYICKAIGSQEDDELYEMHNMHIIMKTIISKDRKVKSNLAIGDIVKVFLASYEHFCRAEITKIDNDKFHIFCIDFGNTEIIDSKNIFELSDDLKVMTDIPLRISIEVPPNAKKTNEIENLFTNLIDENVPLCIEFNEKSPKCFENVFLKEVASGKSINKEVLKLLPVEKLPLKNCDTCILTYFENFNTLYVAKVFESDNIKILHEIASNTDRIPVINLTIGDIVKVFSPTFEDFYRAKIIDITNNGDCCVFYIDYGNTEVVSPSSIFQLSDNLKNNPDLAIKIGLSMPSNVQKNKKISELMSGLVNEAEKLSIEFDESNKDGLNNCILKVISSGLNINNEVIKLSSQSLVSPEKNVKIENKKSLVVKNEAESVTIKNGEVVHIRYFHNFRSVFICKVSEYDRFVDMMEHISLATPRNKLNIQVGDIVLAPFDHLMHRAKILEKKDQSHCYIVYIDFGNENTVHINDIFELPDEFKKVPGCIKVGLKRSPTINITEEVKYYFESIEQEHLYLEYDESSPNGLKEVALKRKSNSDIIDEVYNIIKIKGIPFDIKEKAQHIPKYDIVTAVTASDIELKNGDTVFCSYFKDFNHIYICKESRNNAIPVNMNLILDSSKLKDIGVKKNPRYDDLVWIKFEKNIVRAKIVDKIVDEQLFIVYLIDIGKNTKVYADAIFELPIELKNIPELVIKVGLKDVANIELNEKVQDYFNRLWHNEPVPLILNYDEDNLNYLNKVSLKIQSSGCNIIDDLFKISNSANSVTVQQNPKCHGSNYDKFQVKSGDLVEFLNGNSVENIIIKHLKIYNEFNHIFERLKNEKSENLKSIISPKNNDIVVANSTKLNGFYRTKIIGPSNEDPTKLLRCLFIDYLEFELIPKTCFYALPNYIALKIPPMANRIQLAGSIKNNNIGPFLKSFKGKEFVLEFEENTDGSNNKWFKQATLKDPKSDVSLIEELQLMLVNSSSVQQRLAKKIVMPEEIGNKLQKQPQIIPSGSIVKITHFEDNDSIYIRDSSHNSIVNFNAFNLQIIKHYKTAERSSYIKEMLNIGYKNKLVCARSLINYVMFTRALIIDKIGNQYCVFHVDYGTKEIIEAEDIFELHEKFDKDHYQYFAIKIKLKNMPPLTAENDCELVKDYFKNELILCNQSVILEFDEYDPNGLNNSILKTEHMLKNIVEEIKTLINHQSPDIKVTGHRNQNAEQRSSHTKQSCPITPNLARNFHNKFK